MRARGAVSSDDRLIGCTVSPLADVKSVLVRDGACRFDNIHSRANTIPLRCLLCPLRMGDASGSLAPEGPTDTSPWAGILAEAEPRTQPEAVMERLSTRDSWRTDYPSAYVPKYMVVIRSSQ